MAAKMSEKEVEEHSVEVQKPDTDPIVRTYERACKQARKDPPIRRAAAATKGPAKKTTCLEANEEVIVTHECYAITATTALAVQNTREYQQGPCTERLERSRKLSLPTNAMPCRSDCFKGAEHQ